MAFSIDVTTGVNMAKTDNDCATFDYVGISSESERAQRRAGNETEA